MKGNDKTVESGNPCNKGLFVFVSHNELPASNFLCTIPQSDMLDKEVMFSLVELVERPRAVGALVERVRGIVTVNKNIPDHFLRRMLFSYVDLHPLGAADARPTG